MSVELNQKLKKIRQELGVTQRQVAEKMGIETSQYANIENRKSLPLLPTFKKLVIALNQFSNRLITADELLAVNQTEQELKAFLLVIKIDMEVKKQEEEGSQEYSYSCIGTEENIVDRILYRFKKQQMEVCQIKELPTNRIIWEKS
jgi:transcriptional regulator with XRE-family HTH domain